MAAMDDKNQCLLIFRSIERGAAEAVHLLQTSDDCNMCDVWGTTALHVAAQSAHSACVAYLLRRGCAVDAADQSRLTPLHLSAESGALECAHMLLEAGAEIDRQDRMGYTPLHRAVINRRLDVASLLMRRGCSVNLPDNDKRVALHVAASYGQQALVRQLVAAGANVDWQDKQGWAPLHLAVIGQLPNIINELAQLGCDLNIGVPHWHWRESTPLKLAVEKGDIECVKELLDHGAHCRFAKTLEVEGLPLGEIIDKITWHQTQETAHAQYDSWIRRHHIARMLLQACGDIPSLPSFMVLYDYLNLLYAQDLEIRDRMLYLIHLLLAAGVRPEVAENVERVIADKRTAAVVKSWIQYYVAPVPPLKEICRRHIRRLLHGYHGNITFVIPRVQHLPLPLKNILVLRDI